MGDCNWRETGQVEVSGRRKRVTDEKDSHAKDAGRGQTKYDVCVGRKTGAKKEGDSILAQQRLSDIWSKYILACLLWYSKMWQSSTQQKKMKFIIFCFDFWEKRPFI